MESFVSRREFENGLKEVRRLHIFLADTFGSKFMEFFDEDKLEETEARLKTQLGSGFTSDLLNGSLNSQPPPSSSKVGSIKEKKRNKNEAQSPASSTLPPEAKSPSLVPIIINTTSIRAPPPPLTDKPAAVDVIPVVSLNSTPKKGNVRKVPLKPDHNHSNSPAILPISILPTIPPPPPTSLELPRTTSQSATLIITECITLDDDDGGEAQSSLPPSKQPNDSSLLSTYSHSNAPSSSSGGGMQLRGSNLFRTWPSPPPIAPKRPLVSSSLNDTTTDQLVLTPRVTRSRAKPVTSETDEIIQCQDCHLFIYSSQMVDHLKNHEVLGGGTISQSTVDPVSSSTTSTSVFDRNFTCPLCNKECSNYQEYEDHCIKVHNNENPCPICKKMLSSKATLKRHMAGHENRTFICEVCGKGYNRKDNLAVHSKLHRDGNTTPSAFYCTFCKCAFASKDGRDKHMNSLHMNSCSGQEESMSSSGDLSRDQLIVPGDDNDEPDMIITDQIDIGPEFKVNVDYLTNASSVQFEYEGDEEGEEMY